MTLPGRALPGCGFLIVMAILCSAPALAEEARTLEPGTPASAGMDAAKLEDAMKLYRDAFQRGDIRGAVVLVARHGKIVAHEAIGWKNEAYRLPMDKDVLFRMASTTKPIATTAVLILEDEGKLSTKDPAGKYLASFRGDRSRDITIQHLASGSSGLRIGPIFYPFEKDEQPSLQKAVDKFGKEGAAAPIGTSFSYNNAAFNALGALVEVVSGMPLEDFFTQRIYKPLGMLDTWNHEDPAKLHRMATHYNARVTPSGALQFTQSWSPGDAPDWPVVRASGGLISTALDYAKFLQMHLDEGQYAQGRILSEAAAHKARTPIIKVAACPDGATPCNALTPFGTTDGSYALGWFVSDDGVMSHLGGSANNGNFVWVDPARDIVGVALTSGGRDPRQAFLKAVQDAVK